MSKPDFIMIGAPKSGTTSIYHYLQQHPDINMSALKEPHFFLFDGPVEPRMNGPHDGMRRREMLDDWKKYQALFKKLPNGSVQGEASIRYLYSKQACQAIHRRLADVKLIVILRHPVDRAFSAFQRDRLHGIEPFSSFSDAINDGPHREQAGWHIGSHQSLGYYGRHLAPYLQTFSAEQVRVYLFDDLLEDSAKLIRELFEFLEVDPTFEPKLNQCFNVTGVIKNPVWRILWRGTRNVRSYLMPYIPLRWRGSFFRLASSLSVQKPKSERIGPELRNRLTEEYREDILNLQQLIGRDLSHWLTPIT